MTLLAQLLEQDELLITVIAERRFECVSQILSQIKAEYFLHTVCRNITRI